MKKTTLLIALAAAVGLLVGWLLFGNTDTDGAVVKDASGMADDHDHAAEEDAQMWTCSMHPQIMQPEPGDCPICGMDLIPAETGADGLDVDEFAMTDNAMALANIRTTTVNSGTRDEDGFVALSGRITENDEANTVQASYFDGRIEQLKVTYKGQQVKRGQLLATIYSPNLVAAQQELLTAAALKESQPGLYQAVRNKLKNWKLSDKQIDQIEQSGKVKENFPIYATVSGTVTEVMAARGDYVQAGQPIARLSNLSTVWADFDAYEGQLNQFKVGQDIMITSNAYPNQEFDARISFIDPVLDTQTRTVTVRATLNNNEGLLKPGMFVKGKIATGSSDENGQLTVPSSAVMWTGERSLVYVKSQPDEPVFEMREVQLGNRSGDRFIIVGGLEGGEEIVTNGTFTVDAAAQLQGKKSMMNQGQASGNDDTEKQDSEKMSPTAMEMELPPAFQEKLITAMPAYLELKDALVAGDPNAASTHAKTAAEKTKAIAQDGLGPMLESHLQKSIEMLDAIGTNENLENQRSHFVLLNENWVALAVNLDNVDEILFVQKCPMADNDQGASWLSKQKEIRNPYYGDAMLTCGSIIDSIQ
ncbi:efflux RND transporter periplasmic adaptor subunit [Pricia sp. S334]|uniref:Efflux RND transporter periplasmic adaptor subunit n=1 Tax=Pricia mediterranea TaxID=3076079 RepID=A0ABU3L065_9FLAO|nr:efflux RND transporter periplasmic adaptor subunit [Pricia sp. S334]MDT7827120.1 efflux RND transporter periplasmic adaptor subunit [Pricia sp. S334]